jgi:hypothetical protein
MLLYPPEASGDNAGLQSFHFSDYRPQSKPISTRCREATAASSPPQALIRAKRAIRRAFPDADKDIRGVIERCIQELRLAWAPVMERKRLDADSANRPPDEGTSPQCGHFGRQKLQLQAYCFDKYHIRKTCTSCDAFITFVPKTQQSTEKADQNSPYQPPCRGQMGGAA